MQTHKIAVIEDDLALAKMYEYKLISSGYKVKVACNGQEGLALVEEFTPNLVLLDLRMPVMSGDEMLEKMRATDWGSKPHVIILTNISRDEAPMSLRFLSVDRYVVKAHHTPSQVINIIRDIIGVDAGQTPATAIV